MANPGFEILEVLQHGERTSLLRARRSEDGTPVVLKVLGASGEVGLADLRRLEHEFQVGQKLGDLSAAVKTLEITVYDDRRTLVLEDFGGTSLDKRLNGPMDLGEFLPLATAVAEALHAFHRKGFIHRDIKPHNIIVAEGPSPALPIVKLADFGLTIPYVPGYRVASQAAAPHGTWPYLSPEQTGRMNRAVDFRADLYSLGVMFFELLTGELPFSAKDSLEWMHCHIAKTPPRPADVCRGVPQALSEIVLKLLAKAPEERYQSAGSLVAHLKSLTAAGTSRDSAATFAVGTGEVLDHFQISQQLYGRTRERDTLIACLERAVERDLPAAALVGGYSGVGKTALVREIFQPVVRRKGFFASGKAEELKRNIPYYAIIQAVTELLQQVLGQSEETVRLWRHRLLNALGSNGKVVCELVPTLERLIGAQPLVAELAPAESANRFNLVFQQLVRVFATKDHPLVLFLDDMQWADGATLSLTGMLLNALDMGSLVLILAYRDNEVDATHPFSLTVAQLEKARADLTRISLAPLEECSVTDFIADSLQTTCPDVLPLAEIVVAKTAGNPFFVIELLKTLHQESLLRFDYASQRWQWDAGSVLALPMSKNVIDLLTARLAKLPRTVRTILATAACLGSQFDMESLAAVAEVPLQTVFRHLDRTVELGLVFVVSEGDFGAGAPIYKFNHDKVQQAAYELLGSAEAKVRHLSIARRLLEHTPTEERERSTFEIVAQFNRGLDLVWDQAERNTVLRLNLDAGRLAKAASAYGPATRYFATAISLLPPESWETDDELAFELHVNLYECEFLSSQLREAEELGRVILARTNDVLRRSLVHQTQIRLYQVAGDFDRAVAVFLEAMGNLGYSVPTEEALPAALAEENRAVGALLAGRSVADLISAPEAVDPRIRAALALLEGAGPPIYMVRPAAFPWIALKMVHLSLASGNSQASPYGYGIYGIILAGAGGDVEAGLSFAQLAIDLNDRFKNAKLRGCLLHFLGDHVNFWKNHVSSDLPILERAFAACVESGDAIYSNYVGFQSMWHLWETGAPLEAVLDHTRKYADYARRTKYDAVYQTIRIEQQFVAALQGKTTSPTSLEDGNFDERAAAGVIATAKFGCGSAYYHIIKTILAYHAGDFGAAETSAAQAEAELGAAFSMPIYVTFTFYHALTLCAVADEVADGGERLAKARGYAQQLNLWAEACPQNFRCKAALVAAEIARLEKRLDQVPGLYDQAFEAARENGFTHVHALACERAAAFYLEVNARSVAAHFAHEASTLYDRWGAQFKVRQIQESHGIILRRAGASRATSITTEQESNTLDLLSVLKASQTIASQLSLPELLKTLVNLAVEYAGAERGLLYFAHAGSLSLQAEMCVGHKPSLAPIEGYPASPPSGYPGVTKHMAPASVLNFVRRTEQQVILENASASSPFAADPYIKAQLTKSILCIPLCRQGRLIGVVYLENNLIPGAFTAERLQVLDLLAGQIAVSIDNARLYQDSQDSIRSRDEFLSIVSHELRTPLTALKLQLQMAKMDLEDPALDASELRGAFELSLRQVNSLTSLVEEVLDVSRIQLGNLKLRLTQVDLGSLVHDIVGGLQAQLASARCPVEVKIADHDVSGTWDRDRLAQVLTSMLSNALKYAPGRPVEITVAKTDGNEARLVVTDHGPGIDPEKGRRIFERFERATSKNVSGLGLGLFVARTIVEAHGGSIDVKSERDVATSFIVTLPRAAVREQTVGRGTSLV